MTRAILAATALGVMVIQIFAGAQTRSSRPATPAQPAVPAQVPPAKPALPAPPAQPPKRLFPPLSLGLLEAPDREEWTKPDLIMDALGIADGGAVADLGAGGGWFTARLARRVGPNGVVYAEDVQQLMIEAINLRVQNEGLNNVRTILGTTTDPRLPPGLDAVLIVDAYHEMDEPAHPDYIVTFLRNVAAALKPQGRLGVVDFLAGGGGPGPAAEDRVSAESVIASAQAAGFRLQSRETIPPFQFLLVFTAVSSPAARQ